MLEVELDPLESRIIEQVEHENRSLDASLSNEHLNESELRPLVEQPPAVVPEQQQTNDSQSENATVQVLKVPPITAVGKTGTIMLSISTVVIFASMSMLAYLWTAQKNMSTAGYLWRLIATKLSFPQVVTLCTMALRWGTAVQFCLFTSMLASVAVENFQVTLSQIMTVSIMRATSAEPLELLWALLHGNHYILWAIRTIALTTILLLLQTSFQLSSTILLSDLRPGQIRGNVNTREIRYGLRSDLQEEMAEYTMDNPWGFKPPFWPTFAEYSERPIDAEGVIDTGFAIRTFLPFTTAQDRQSVGNFSGDATSISARVTCFRPPLSNLNIHGDPSFAADDSPGFITGDINFSEVQFQLLKGCVNLPCRGSQEQIQSFNCTLNMGKPELLPEWSSTLCPVEEPLRQKYFSNTESPYFGNGYLLFNVTGYRGDWSGIGLRNQSVTNLTTSTNAEWTHIDVPKRGGRVSATLCYYNQAPLIYHKVTMSRESGGIEPKFEWDAVRGQHDMVDIRHQLGIYDQRSLSHQERGILSLNEWEGLPDGLISKFSVQLFKTPNGTSFTLCQLCFRSDFTSIHRTLTTLFQDVIIRTSNPALALQALFTTVSQMTYYSLLSEFDLAGNTSVTPFITISVPQRWTGFGVVAGLVTTNFVCGVLVMLLFFKKCQCSMLGQVWRCIAQVRSGDTDVVLKQASIANDDDIRLWLKKHGKGETRVGILPWKRRST